MFLKTIIYHFFDTETKQEFDNLEISTMQSRLSAKYYENYVSISGQVKLPKKMKDAIQSLSSSPNSYNNDNDIDDNILSMVNGSDPFTHEDDYFTDLLNKYESLLYINYKNVKNYDIENSINGIRTLTLRSPLYSWILKNFDSNSIVTKLCFHDIVLSKVWIDVDKQHHPERDITTIVRGCAI